MWNVPNTGIHAYRLWDIAVVDVVLTLLGAWLLARALDLSFVAVAAGSFAAGVAAHRVFHIRTTVDRWLFP